MKLTPSQKKVLIVAGVAVVGVFIYRSVMAAKHAPIVIGNKTLVSPESTITIGPPTIKPVSQTWDKSFADTLAGLI